MIDGLDRVVDLVGPRSSGLDGATEVQVVSAVARCDTAALAATDGHFAAIGRDGRTVRLARTVGLPLRYFVAKMNHGPFLIVSDRIDRIFDWCQDQRIGWQFDPIYTRMVPAHYVVELDQVGCPDPAPRYHRFFNPPVGHGPSDLTAAGHAYIRAAYEATKRWVSRIPPREPVAVAFSGGIDSTAVLLLARRAFEELGRDPDRVRPLTLDIGGGTDAMQAETVVRELRIDKSWDRVVVPATAYDLEAAIDAIEDYHPLDVECAAAALCLLTAVRERHPHIHYLLDGDGGDENLKSYPLEDSDLTLASVLRNPLLYQEGWGVDAIKHSEVYSGGLSRSYVRTSAPAAAKGFEAFSPFTVRSVIAAAVAIPFGQLLGPAGPPSAEPALQNGFAVGRVPRSGPGTDNGDVGRLYSLKQDVVRAGIQAVLGIDMPAHPKRRFQDGARAGESPRVSKAWCRQVFTRAWEDRLRNTPDSLDVRRSGNEIPAF